MRIDQRFILREVAGEYIVVPTGKKAESCKGLIFLNSSGAFLWSCLQEECTQEELVSQMLQEYDAPVDVLWEDLKQFLLKMQEIGCLEHENA